MCSLNLRLGYFLSLTGLTHSLRSYNSLSRFGLSTVLFDYLFYSQFVSCGPLQALPSNVDVDLFNVRNAVDSLPPLPLRGWS